MKKNLELENLMFNKISEDYEAACINQAERGLDRAINTAALK